MKTTLHISDAIYGQIKFCDLLHRQTGSGFLMDSIQEKLGRTREEEGELVGWRSVIGQASHVDLENVQTAIDEEFSHVEPEDWK